MLYCICPFCLEYNDTDIARFLTCSRKACFLSRASSLIRSLAFCFTPVLRDMNASVRLQICAAGNGHARGIKAGEMVRSRLFFYLLCRAVCG